jgi:hypothetical protein
VTLADMSTTYIERLIDLQSRKITHVIQLPEVTQDHLAFLERAQLLTGDVGKSAIALLTIVKEIESIRSNTTIALKTLEHAVEKNTHKIAAMSMTLSVLQAEIAKLPDDYSDPEMMNMKNRLIDRMCDITMKLAHL